MTDFFRLKRGDTSPSLRYELIPAEIDLLNAAVRFQMMDLQGVTVIDEVATIEQTSSPPIVSYSWQAGDTAVIGQYNAEFAVTYTNGTVETFPNCGFIAVEICRDVPNLVV